MEKSPDLAVHAIQAEIQQMVSKGVFEPVDLLKIPKTQESSRIFSSMFLKEKLNPDGSLKKLKARLVAGGHMQDRNLYEESSISSPTVSVPAVLMVAALGADQRAVVHTIDFPGAYLNSDMKDNIKQCLSILDVFFRTGNYNNKKDIIKNKSVLSLILYILGIDINTISITRS